MQAEQFLYEIEKKGSGLAQIEDLFNRALNFTQSDLGTRGCMVCNAIAEFGDKEPEIWHATTTHVDRFRVAIKKALINSRQNKEIDSSINPTRQANFLTSVLQSLMLMSRTGTEYSIMKDTVDLSLKSLR